MSSLLSCFLIGFLRILRIPWHRFFFAIGDFELPNLPPFQARTKKCGLTWNIGAGVKTGKRHNHWDLLADILEELSPRKLVPTEELLSNHPEWPNFSGDESDTDQANAVSLTTAARYRILKVELSRYTSPDTIKLQQKERLRRLTRLAVSKQIFGAFINRLIAYNYPTVIGLVSIGTSASLAQPLTEIIDNFRHTIDTFEASGDTSLWDALALAADQLVHFGQKYPGIKKRIICLSDGIDTRSARTASDVCRRLVREKIVVDSCSIGMGDNSDLRTISFMTGGYKFVPNTLEQAVAVCELEPVLSIHERPPVAHPVIAPLLTAGSFALASTQAVPDKVTRDNFPVRKSHPSLGDQFVHIRSFEHGTRHSVVPLLSITPVQKSALLQRRLHIEIQNIAANPHPLLRFLRLGIQHRILEGRPLRTCGVCICFRHLRPLSRHG